jgi:hypothetical protein
MDPLCKHGLIVSPEIIRAKEKKYAPAGLISDRFELFGGGCSGEQDICPFRIRWRDQHPALILAGW